MSGSCTKSIVIGLFLISSSHGSAAPPAAAETGARAHITVNVYNYASVPAAILARAQDEAARIYRKAGVESVWLDCTAGLEGAGRKEVCLRTSGPTGLFLKILPREMAERFPTPDGWLGFAALASAKGDFGAHASIFFHRVEEIQARVSGIGLSAGQLLGHVMAHEIGHLLLGSGSHSGSGLMHIPWDRKQLLRAARGELRFTGLQKKKIRQQVRARAPEDSCSCGLRGRILTLAQPLAIVSLTVSAASTACPPHWDSTEAEAIPIVAFRRLPREAPVGRSFTAGYAFSCSVSGRFSVLPVPASTAFQPTVRTVKDPRYIDLSSSRGSL
jgi:hypothetical protein